MTAPMTREELEFGFAWDLNEALCEIIEAGTTESREIASRTTTHPKLKKWLDHGAAQSPPPEAEADAELADLIERRHGIKIVGSLAVDSKWATDRILAALRRKSQETRGDEVAGLHPDTANLVNKFAFALATKLRSAEIKYGYQTGWRDDAWENECRSGLISHVMKGDPLDVAAFAAFCWARGWKTTPYNPDHEEAFLPIFERWADCMLIGEGDRDILRGDVRAALSPPQQETRPKARAIDWVKCPICGEPDMRKEADGEGFLIRCVNHGCPSNGAVAQQETPSSAGAPALAELPGYLDCLESDLMGIDADMKLKGMIPPSVWADRVRAVLSATPAPAAPPDCGAGEAVAFINARLADLAEANALYGKDHRLGTPDKIARNDREISWLKDLRSMIATLQPSQRLEREALQRIVDLAGPTGKTAAHQWGAAFTIAQVALSSVPSTDPREVHVPGVVSNRNLLDAELCSDCPPVGYPTDKTRCVACPRLTVVPSKDRGAV